MVVYSVTQPIQVAMVTTRVFIRLKLRSYPLSILHKCSVVVVIGHIAGHNCCCCQLQFVKVGNF